MAEDGTYQAVFAQTASSDAGMASFSSLAPIATMSALCRHRARAAVSASETGTLPRLITVQPWAWANASALTTKLS